MVFAALNFVKLIREEISKEKFVKLSVLINKTTKIPALILHIASFSLFSSHK